MAKTILPTADPESPYYPQDAALFSILLTRREEVMPWIHNNYKQIYCHREMYTNYTADFLKVDIPAQRAPCADPEPLEAVFRFYHRFP